MLSLFSFCLEVLLQLYEINLAAKSIWQKLRITSNRVLNDIIQFKNDRLVPEGTDVPILWHDRRETKFI